VTEQWLEGGGELQFLNDSIVKSNAAH
jgi:hypothetical protein